VKNTDIITKYIPNEIVGVIGDNFLENTLLFLVFHYFQLLLDKTRTVLIAAEFNDVSTYFLSVQMSFKEE